METHAVTTDVPALARLQQRALILAVVGLVAGGAGAVLNPDQFFRSWLVGFLLCLALTTGSLALLMLQHLSGGQWGLIGRRIFEAASRNLPVVMLFFLPLLFRMPSVYHWAAPGAAAHDEILRQKAGYLNVPFFIGRAVFYFLTWMLCTFMLNKYSAAQERGEAGMDPADTRQARVVAAPGLLVYALTISFAAVDWVMSINAHWFSTIFGMLLMVSQGLTAFAFVIAILALLIETEPLASYLTSRHFHDFGKLLLAFVMLWAYLAFSQFLIIWGANLPEEIPWYLQRIRGPWGYVSLLLAFGQFVLPFLLLLSRNLKERASLLAKVAIGVLIMRLIDLIWLVEPNYERAGFPIHWMDVAVPGGLLGVWLFLFVRQLRSRSLLPLNDPFFKKEFAHEAH
jgi:hypothetical protein